MKKAMMFILEFVRVTFLLVLLFTLFGIINNQILSFITGTTRLPNLLGLSQMTGFIIFITVIYRNKLQFNGFFRSGTEKAFSPKVTRILLLIGTILVCVPYLILIIG